MGCTSSAANIPDTQSGTTDDTENKVTRADSSEQIEENDIIYSNSKELEQKQVLPESEIKMQVEIVSDDNNKSTENNGNVENKDEERTSPTEKQGETENAIEAPPLNDNFVSHKVVIEKVISENTEQRDQIANVIETRSVDLDRQIEEIITESNVNEGGELEINYDEAKEAPSPTQSEDSRATRWEALADIAAELPPSLAVDPLTGQIYSLAK